MDDSITSVEENTKNPKSLFLEIEKINNDEWENEKIQFSPHPSFHQSFEQSQEQNSFANDLPLQSKIHQQFLQAQQALNFNILNENEQNLQNQKSQLKSPQLSSLSQNSNFPSQATITLHEQTLASKVYEQIQTQDDSSFSISLRSFLSLNNKNYRPHIACMKHLYQKLKDFSKRSLDNLRIYINFLQIKMKQQIQSLKLLDEIQANFISPQLQINEDDVNIDQRVLMDVMKNNNSKRRMVRKVFYNNIKQVYENLLSIWKKIKQKREKKERYIEQQILRIIERIQLQMQDMIKCRLLNEKQKSDSKFISQKIRSHNPYLTKDKYLQMKYLIQRQNAYLKLITDLNGKLITYTINMFSKEQIQMARGMQDAMIEYANYYMQCYDHNNQIIYLKIANIEEVNPEVELKLELADLLITFIPKQLYEVNAKDNKLRNNPDKLEAILGDFSQYLQNTIFLPSIQMNNEFIMFRNQAIWKTKRSILQKQESAIDYQSKQALANSRSHQNATNIPEFKENLDIKIVVVLTSNYFLHLQNEDKVATIKLGDVKLSKKGRQVIITDRGKGISGYFGFKSQLGRLQFQSTDDVEVFAQKLSYALRKITFS